LEGRDSRARVRPMERTRAIGSRAESKQEGDEDGNRPGRTSHPIFGTEMAGTPVRI